MLTAFNPDIRVLREQPHNALNITLNFGDKCEFQIYAVDLQQYLILRKFPRHARYYIATANYQMTTDQVIAEAYINAFIKHHIAGRTAREAGKLAAEEVPFPKTTDDIPKTTDDIPF